MKRKILKTSGIVLGAIIILVLIIFIISWKSPAYYKVSENPDSSDSIIPFNNYDPEHPRPFIISQPGLVVFGATHTRDRHHEEIKMMENEWRKLKPTIALVEGRLGFLLPGLMDPVKTLGEGGKLMQLSKRDRVKVYNWDLSKEQLAHKLKNRFSPEQIALSQILNPYFSQLRFGKPSNPEKFVAEFLKRAANVNQQNNFRSVDDVDRVWKKYFATEKDWRDTSDETELPGFLSRMMTYSNDLRNQQLVAVIKELTAKGEKPFVVCGSSHAVCIAPCFR